MKLSKTVYKTKFEITTSNHLIIFCSVNGIKSQFLIDSGASNSCINYLCSKKFNLILNRYNERASSATNEIKEMYYSKKNILKIGELIHKKFEVILFDMSQINASLSEKNIQNIDGIIGGDVLIEFNAVINYKKKELILKQ